jgi:hypothetical protein
MTPNIHNRIQLLLDILTVLLALGMIAGAVL